jgi:peptidoglycan hydrolase CwlO-like protein
MTKAILIVIAAIFLSSAAICQSPAANVAKKLAATDTSDPRRASAAYAEVLLRRTEIEADLESMLVEYTEDYPKVKQERFELGLIGKESERLLAVKAGETSKLTAALGKLIVRKVELQGELWNLQQQLGDAHPDVKRAKRKVEIFESAIKEILG